MYSGVLTSTLRHNGVNASMTLDAAKWNGAGGDLSSCVTNIILLDHVSYYSEHFWSKFTSGLFILSCFMYLYIYIYIYVYVSYVLWFACIVSFSTYIYSMQ